MTDAGRQSADHEVDEFMRESLDAVRAGDADGLAASFSDDYDLVIQTGDVLSKDQIVGFYRSDQMKQGSLEVNGLDIRTYGDAAVVRATYRSIARFGDQDIDDTFVRTDFLVKRSGAWKIVASQATQAPSAG